MQRARVREHLEIYLADTAQSWLLKADGRYVRAEGPADAVSAQMRMLAEAGGIAVPGLSTSDEPTLKLAPKARPRRKANERALGG